MSKSILALLVFASIGTGVYAVSTRNSPSTPQAVVAEAVPTETQDQAQSQATDIDKVTSQADFLKYYNSYDELVQDADVVIEGKVLETRTVDYTPQGHNESSPQTVSKVQVTKSYNENANVGEILTFVEAGGVTTKKAIGLDKKLDLPKEKWNDKIQIDFNGVPAMKANEKVLLFGVKPQSNFKVIDEPHYYIAGAHQGKFIINENSVARPVPNHMKDELNPLRSEVADLEPQLKDSVAKKAKRN